MMAIKYTLNMGVCVSSVVSFSNLLATVSLKRGKRFAIQMGVFSDIFYVILQNVKIS